MNYSWWIHAIFIGSPLVAALIALIVGIGAEAPACFLLSLGFCFLASCTTYLSAAFLKKFF